MLVVLKMSNIIHYTVAWTYFFPITHGYETMTFYLKLLQAGKIAENKPFFFNKVPRTENSESITFCIHWKVYFQIVH